MAREVLKTAQVFFFKNKLIWLFFILIKFVLRLVGFEQPGTSLAILVSLGFAVKHFFYLTDLTLGFFLQTNIFLAKTFLFVSDIMLFMLLSTFYYSNAKPSELTPTLMFHIREMDINYIKILSKLNRSVYFYCLAKCMIP